jgi:murein L,D-transpeptidase YcbB/YkuD
MRLSPLLPLALLIPGGGFLALALSRKAHAQSPAAPTPPEPALAPDQTPAQAAQAALDAQADHDTAQEATAAAMDRAAAASRQATESTAAAQQAQSNVTTAATALNAAVTSQAPPAAIQSAQAQLDAAKAAHDRELTAITQAQLEAETQRRIAAEAAQQALLAKQKKAAAIHHVAKALQNKPISPTPAPAPSAASEQALFLAATALEDFLHRFPFAESYGAKGHPSGPVQDFQAVASKNGHPLVRDGILGPRTRAVAELVGIVLPPRPAATAAHPATPSPAPVPVHEPPPAPPGTSTSLDVTKAKALAAQVVANMRRLSKAQRYDYDRNTLKAFQLAAGLKPDGVYGGTTRGALIYFGQANAPKPLFAPTNTIPYQPPLS